MSIIATPKENDNVAGPAQGKSLRCSGEWIEEERIDHQVIKIRHPNEDLVVTLIQPNAANQVLRTTTDRESKWDVAYSSCRPGAAQLKVEDGEGNVLATVNFSIVANQREPIAVTLDNGDPPTPFNGAHFPVKPAGTQVSFFVFIGSPTKYVECQTSLDNYLTTTRLRPSGTGLWSGTLSFAGLHAPSSRVLLVRDVDFFDEARPTTYDFWLDDKTPPTIDILEPTEDQELYLAPGQTTRDITVHGTVSDNGQSGYQPRSLVYTFGRETKKIEPDSRGNFTFVLENVGLGPTKRIYMTAEDKSIPPNKGEVVREFIVASKYKPKTIDELLGRRSYLADLIRFANSHVLIEPNKPLDSNTLSTTFMPTAATGVSDFFGALAEPGSNLGERVVNELLPAVTLLRHSLRRPLVHFAFETEQGQETPDSGPRRMHARLSQPGMIGRPGSPTAGALELDGQAHAFGGVGVSNLLSEVGKDNADFSVSFWIVVRDSGVAGGPWRGILYKGHEPTASDRGNRTFGIWLYPDYNNVHYSISTTKAYNVHQTSVERIQIGQWTHIAYVRRGNSLELFLNGKKDSWVTLTDPVVANSDNLFFGMSPPNNFGFRGALDEVRIYNFALSESDIRLLSRSRSDTDPIVAYLRTAYEALLVAHGTSYEELRTLPGATTFERRALATRLGLTLADATDDGLGILVLPVGFADDTAVNRGTEFGLFENWLGSTFDLPSTKELLPTTTVGRRGTLLVARQDYLSRRWQAEDAAAVRPLLDPDLVEPTDLDPGHGKAVIALLSERQAELERQYTTLHAAADVGQALALVYDSGEVARLATIESRGQAGESIAELLPPLGLTMRGFRRLRFYQKLTAPLSEREKDDLAHLLTQVWKLRRQYPLWVVDERSPSLPLWPNSLRAGGLVIGNFKRDFLPWRGSVAERIQFEKIVATRMEAFNALGDAHEQAVLAAQNTALPQFRNRLLPLSDLSSSFDAMDALTERLLVDVASTGAINRTLIDQACLMLQSLINGIRLRRFEAGPAANWTLRTTWNNDPPDTDLKLFDEEWSWMGSYASWRSAKTTYLYPENRIFPDLRDKNSTPYTMSGNFKIPFLKELRRLAPSVPDDQWIAGMTVGVSSDEKTFFVPVAVGVMLERSGQYSHALDWYRKVYETRKPGGSRALAQVLDEVNKPPIIQYDDRWTLDLDPHTNARKAGRFGNPYTRFILARITRCYAALADAEFARGTDESRVKALDLYLEAKQILAFDELKDLPPADASEGYLPNPVFSSLRDHVSASLRKLRRGLTYIGTPMISDGRRATEDVSLLTRPTSYRFRVLMDRAKQLLTITQNLEAQYLAALEKRDVEEEKSRREAGSVGIAEETVNLRRLQQTESKNGVNLARAQQSRVTLQRDRYESWIAAGPNQYEDDQVSSLWAAKRAADVVAGLEASITGVSAVPSSPLDEINPFAWVRAGVISGLASAKAIAQGFANYDQTLAQVSGIRAAQERRQQEWELQRDLAKKETLIAQEQIDLANDRKDIADKEYTIAVIQRDQAVDMLKFLNNKFTSVEFYEWMIGVLSEVYAFLLRTSTLVAQQAEGQLAFQRQQSSAGMIKLDYWNYVSTQGSGSTQPGSNDSSAKDRRGITASNRLLQDLTSLDQYAFDTEKRLLNLSQTFSLSRLCPIEFEEFHRTGLLSFATTIRMFDEGFPGHYMRMIKRVRLSVVALIPPNQGIRATLSTAGLSRVVTGDPGFPTMLVCQDPQSVALTSAAGSTGLFDVDMQSELLFPFEDMGVDASWWFELPPAGNPFDFSTLFDVLISIDYTALHSNELRERVVKRLPQEMIGDRSFSVRRDLPDTWYELGNNAVSPARIPLAISTSDFPPHLSDVRIREVACAVHRKDGRICDFKMQPSIHLSGDRSFQAAVANSVKGIVSSRQSGAATWHSQLLDLAGAIDQAGITWNFDLADVGGEVDSALQLLRAGEIDDILIVFTFAGVKPAWPT